MKLRFGLPGLLLGVRGLTKEIRLARVALERIADRMDEVTGHRTVVTDEAPAEKGLVDPIYRDDALLMRAEAVERRLSQTLGRAPSVDEIAAELNLDQVGARETLR